MTLLREGQEGLSKHNQEDQEQHDTDVLLSQLRTESEDTLLRWEAHWRASRDDSNKNKVRRMLDKFLGGPPSLNLTLSIDDASADVYIYGAPRKYIYIAVEGTGEKLVLYDRKKVPAEYAQRVGYRNKEQWGFIDATEAYRRRTKSKTAYSYRKIGLEDAQKYKEVLDLTRETLRYPAVAHRNPQG